MHHAACQFKAQATGAPSRCPMRRGGRGPNAWAHIAGEVRAKKAPPAVTQAAEGSNDTASGGFPLRLVGMKDTSDQRRSSSLTS